MLNVNPVLEKIYQLVRPLLKKSLNDLVSEQSFFLKRFDTGNFKGVSKHSRLSRFGLKMIWQPYYSYPALTTHFFIFLFFFFFLSS
jgi:hypothetical protein